MAPLESIFGQIYVSTSDRELGIGSYHFVTEGESYISYENEKCKDIFPRLDNRGSPGIPGDRMPRKMPFLRASWEPKSRTFRGTVTFSIDMGTYEEVRTVDGVEKEEYELVFSDDFEDIVDGCCRSWYPNASRSHRCEHFGTDLSYRRWPHALAPVQPAWPDRPAPPTRPVAVEPSSGDAAAVDHGGAAVSTQAAAAALLSRDVQKLQRLLESGVPVDSEVDAVELWRSMRWDPGAQWQEAPPRTPLLVAAILLQWPEGVQLCVQHGACVDECYAGPFRLASGGVGGALGGTGAPLLRLALSAQSQAQCLICRYIVDGGVSSKTFQRLRRKEQQEMEFDTKDLFNHWLGPFSDRKF